MAIILGSLILVGLAVLQSAVFSRIVLLHGTADLLLLAIIAWALHKRVETAWHWGAIAGLIISIISALPFGAALAGYLLATLIALLLRQRVWQTPILAMFIATFLGTVLTHAISLVSLRLVGSPLPIIEALNLVTLPSLLLNFLLAIPIFALITDLANWIYPEELEI